MPTRHLLTAALALLACPTAHAHGGGLNKDGCHSDRKNGGYHCHRDPAASPARARDMPAPQFLTPSRPRPVPAAPSAPGFQYRNCTEARAAGAAPVHRGDPGYGPHLRPFLPVSREGKPLNYLRPFSWPSTPIGPSCTGL